MVLRRNHEIAFFRLFDTLSIFVAPVGAITSYSFQRFAKRQWLEQAVSPPQDLTAFTMIFQILTRMFFSEPVQIACYGDHGDACHLSLVININLTLEVIIESTRFVINLISQNIPYQVPQNMYIST